MRSFAERAAINAPIQGAAADIIKRAMIRVPPALEKASLRARMLLQVHDELLLEVPEGEVEKTSAVVREVMENACHPAVQLSVRSEEHTSELQSLMRISYAVFCLKKKKLHTQGKSINRPK